MKVGYPDTINNKAYEGAKPPSKMVEKSKADLNKDGKASDYEENRAEAAFVDAPLNYSPIKAIYRAAKDSGKVPSTTAEEPEIPDLIAKNRAGRKADAEKAQEAEAAIRESQSSSKSRKKTKLGRAVMGLGVVGGIKKAIQARKERRNDGENDNPKAKQREIGRKARKANKKKHKFDIKTQKALVTKARQDNRTPKALARQTKRLKKVTTKVGEKVKDVKEGTLIGNVVKNIATAINKNKNKNKK